MVKYGITWWGQQWLNSLARIDYTNRLPRGRSYAGKGAVSGIQILKNTISAKVKGSRPRPYLVDISVPIFTAEQNQTLTDIISNNPHLLSRLLNKELDSAIDSIARKEGIHIFPESWKDFKMNCSCPDWAVPCKHLAAVLYLVANEIDKNPFILFNLHGIDLLAQFAGMNQMNPLAPIETVDSLLIPYSGNTQNDNLSDIRKITGIDLSELSLNPPDVLTLLTSSPVFCQIDFKKLLQNAFTSVARNTSNPDFEPEPGTATRESKVVIIFDKSHSICAAEISDGDVTFQVTVERLVRILSGIEDKELEFLDPSWIFLHKIFLVSLQIASNKIYFPRLFKSGKDRYVLKYFPAVFCNQVKIIFDKLADFHPTGLIEIRTGKKAAKTRPVSFADQDMIICSVFLGQFIKQYGSGKSSSIWEDRRIAPQLSDLFRDGYAEGFNTFETERIPESVHQWLSVFDIHSRKFTAILQVEEEGNDFVLSILVSEDESANSSTIPLADIFATKKYDKIRLDILKDLSIVGNYLSQVNTLLSVSGKGGVLVSRSEFSTILINVLPLVRLLGVKILLPKSLRYLVRPKLMLQLNNKKKNQVSVKSLVGLTELLEYTWEVMLGDQQVDAREFLQQVKGLSGLVRLKDQYIFLDENEMLTLRKNLERNGELTSFQLLQASISGELPDLKAGLSPEVVKLVKEALIQPAIDLPNGLSATLRPYQKRGFEWLARNAELGMGSIIADDMGLGKTLQVICLLLHYKNLGAFHSKKALVVVPTTLISNWEREIARFAPGISFYSYHGSDKNSGFNNYDVIITSYGMIRNTPNIFDKQRWKMIIADEAQNIKNHITEQTKAVKKIKAEIRIAMSGTPVENRLSDYWSIFDFVNKGYLGSIKTFNEDFGKPIHYNQDVERIELFRRITSPFVLRRLKTDKMIISDLPDKVETNYYSSLTTEQHALYKNLIDSTLEQIEHSEGIERKGLVFKLMIALKQIGNHPYQFLSQGEKGIALSGKSQLMAELVKNISDSNEKVILFTQFKEMGDLITDFIRQVTGTTPLFLHGGCTRKQRDIMIEKFQNGSSQVFILSLKAGGTGLNLTAASHVIHYDLWWNPAVEAQATDRAFRIGQKKNVQVYRMINKGTIEEKIDMMIREKRHLADMTVTPGETWIGSLSDGELRELVKL